MAAADLAPPCWPENALLLVRSLGVRTRGGIPGFLADAIAPALRDRVAAIARQAARPERGRLPADAWAVRFENLAEALAVFALSAAEQRSSREWWWALVWRHAEASEWVRIWLQNPAETPSAVAFLDSWGALSAVTRAISPPRVQTLFRELARAFALRHVAEVLVSASAGLRPPQAAGSRVVEASVWPWLRIATPAEEVERELEALAGARIDRTLPAIGRAWIAASLGLVRAPQRVRAPRFAALIERIVDSGSVPRGAAAPDRPSGRAAGVATPDRAEAGPSTVEDNHDTRLQHSTSSSPPESAEQRRAGWEDQAEVSGADSSGGRGEPERDDDDPLARTGWRALHHQTAVQSDRALEASRPSPEPSTPAASGKPWRAPDARAEMAREDSGAGPLEPVRDVDEPRARPGSPASGRPAAVLSHPNSDAGTPLPEEIVQTSFGGVFYLANVALALDFYADFSEPLRPGLELPFWDFLAAVGEKLATDEAEARALRADALWGWLARMSGREESEEPDAGVAAPQAWRIPEKWRTWAGEYSAPESDVVQATSWGEWFGQVLPWIELRLRLALNAAPGSFLRQTSVVVRSRLRVDVHFALALHPIEIRLAGLDRDPGWIPAAGADLRFVYE